MAFIILLIDNYVASLAEANCYLFADGTEAYASSSWLLTTSVYRNFQRAVH